MKIECNQLSFLTCIFPLTKGKERCTMNYNRIEREKIVPTGTERGKSRHGEV